MFIIVQPLKRGPGKGPLYLEATFENPQHGKPPLALSKSSLETSKLGVEFEVSPVTGMLDRKKYQVTVRSFADAKHISLLGIHTQSVLYHNIGDPEAILRRLDANR